MRSQLLTLSMVALCTLVPAVVTAAAPQQSAAPQQGSAMHEHAHQQATSGEIDVHQPGMHHDFSNVARYAKGFDNPERVEWQKPDEVISLMAIEPGMTVADIGAGTGFFEPYLAGAVGTSGKVLALDVEPNMVQHITERASEAGLHQVEARRVDPNDPGLGTASVDRILVVNTWHHIDDRGTYSGKLRAALRPGGAVYIVDFNKTSKKGPPPEHKLEPRQVIAELEAGGLQARQVDEDLPEQYIIVGRLPQ